MTAFKWALIETGATFHALVGDLLLHDDPLTNIFSRDGADGAIDALSGDSRTVLQSKHHRHPTPGKALADARRELKKIIEYQKPGNRWYPIWKDVTGWKLLSNVSFGPDDEKQWQEEIVPKFAKVGLKAEHMLLPRLEALLTDHPAVADAFFGQRPRLFVSLAEHREAQVMREVLPRAYELPIEGRDAELDAIVDFVRNSEKQVLLVHGPGGLGKTRLSLEAARRLVEDGAIGTIYCGTPSLATSDNWYVGIVPESKALVLLDEPTDPKFIERFLFELKTHAKTWKVIVSVRTPRDPVIRVLTDPRERLLAPALEITPLADDAASRCAKALLAPLAMSDDDRVRATRWLAGVCGNVPIWMTVGVALLERGADLSALPRDEFEIAQKYIRDIVEHTRPEIADAQQLMRSLRWVALAQPVNRQSATEMQALVTACGLEVGAMERLIEDLLRRRVVTAFGIRGRMLELRPDVLRDHVLVDWLTIESGGGRQPSVDARTLAASLATTEVPIEIAAAVMRALGRLEFLVQPRIRFLEPIADAAVQRAEAATGTLEQERSLEFAEVLAFPRPGHLARVAKALRTNDVPETALDTPMGTFPRTRAQVVNALPWQLFIAAHGAATHQERQAVLDELVALVDQESGGARPFYSAGRSARELLPRVLHERHGFRTPYDDEVASAARRLLDGLARGEQPRQSHELLLRAMLTISRHDSYEDADDENVVHIENIRILREGKLGQIATSIRERLWKIVEQPGPWSEARRLSWALLVEFHSQLNQNRADEEWGELVLTDLERARDLAECSSTLLEDLQSARGLWSWHLKHEKVEQRKGVATACETAYLAVPLVARFAPLFSTDIVGGRRSDMARAFAMPGSIGELDSFFEEALRFASTQTDDWKSRRVLSFAELLGEFHAAAQAIIREFIEKHLRAGASAPRFPVALAMASGFVERLRMDGDAATLAQTLEWIVGCLGNESDVRALLSTLFVQPGPASAQRFGKVDYEFLVRHWDLFARMPQEDLHFALGRLLPATHDALERALQHVAEQPEQRAEVAVAGLWRGYFEALPYPLAEADVSPALVARLVEATALLPDARGPRGNLEWEIGQILAKVPSVSLGWLAGLVRRRLAAFGNANRTGESRKRYIHILPDDKSFIWDYVECVPDAEPTDDARRSVVDFLSLESADATIEHDLPEFLVKIDPHGRLVPQIVAARLSELLETPTFVEIRKLARIAGWYAVGSTPWRAIASAACHRCASFEDEDRWDVYSALRSHRMEGWSGKAGEIHPRWQHAVDDVSRALEKEENADLRGYWEWSVRVAQDRLEIERGRLEERE